MSCDSFLLLGAAIVYVLLWNYLYMIYTAQGGLTYIFNESQYIYCNFVYRYLTCLLIFFLNLLLFDQFATAVLMTSRQRLTGLFINTKFGEKREKENEGDAKLYVYALLNSEGGLEFARRRGSGWVV